jgi:hypothetical protein
MTYTPIASGAKEIPLAVNGKEIITVLEVSDGEEGTLAGGTLNYVKGGA